MTPEKQALMRAIVENPADNTSRLVYADWLTEYGDTNDCPRAELIRVQVELAGYEGYEESTAARRFHVLRHRERVLIETGRLAHWFDWAGRPAEFGESLHLCWWPGGALNTGRVEGELSRGFVGSVSLNLAAWLAYGPDLVRAHPLEKVWLLDRTPGLGRGTGRITNGCWASDEDGGSPSSACVLPHRIWLMISGTAWPHEGRLIKALDSAEDACDALSHACLAWAREAANDT